jgi:pimeloyl-ACP methyl ester carboxylesterase
MLSGICLWLAGCATPEAGPAVPGNQAAPPTARRLTYVIVHGAWGGGWAFKEVDRLLTGEGHEVYRPTLTGQGERSHLAATNLLGSNIDLETHITDVVNVILWEDLHDVVLVGHSYGGMVITGVADRVPERISHLVYLDAILPEPGESVNTAMGSSRPQPERNGFVIPLWVTGDNPPPHDVPHPANTLKQPIVLRNQPAVQKIPSTYILTVDPGRDPQLDNFHRFYQRAKARGWTTALMEGDHNVQWSHPKALVRLLESAGRRSQDGPG